MRTILKILAVSFFCCTIAEARNEYLNDGTNSCNQGSWEAYSEVRQHEYKTGTSDESQTQVLGFRWRKDIGPVCDDKFAEEQRLKQKLKTQLELVKECKRVPRINPPPKEFAELINMCASLGIMPTSRYGERDFDPKISYWTVLKEKYLKDNPDVVTLDNYREKQ